MRESNMNRSEFIFSLRYAHERSKTVREICDRELTEKQKEAVALCIFEGVSVTRAAARLGVNKSTVSRHLDRARHRIEQSLRYAGYPLADR